MLGIIQLNQFPRSCQISKAESEKVTYAPESCPQIDNLQDIQKFYQIFVTDQVRGHCSIYLVKYHSHFLIPLGPLTSDYPYPYSCSTYFFT